MKKLIILLCVLMLVLFMTSTVASFEAITSGGFGWLMMEGKKSVTAYSVGMNIPIVEKQSSGFLLKTEPTYLYSNGFDGEEMQVLRIYLVAEKTLFSRYSAVDSVGVKTKVWRVYVATGSGTWQFMKTGDGAADDPRFGAHSFRIGGEYNSFVLALSVDMVQMEGSDIVAPFFSMAFTF